MATPNDPTNYRQAHFRIKQLWRSGKVVFWTHANLRMGQRFIDRADIENVIVYGRIVEHGKPGGRWRYALLGKAIDGERAKVIVEINGELAIVSAM